MNAPARVNHVQEVTLMLNQRQDEFRAALPAHIPVERFMRVVLTAIQTNPDLAKAERRSLFTAAVKSAQDGLLPDGREAALVIYRDKNRGEIAQYMPMIAGLRKKVRNSGEIATWDANVVYENDAFDFELGDNPHISHKPAMGERGKPVAAYSIATLKSGEKSREVMSITEIEAIRRRSRAADRGPWVSDYAEMCRKTVARRHSKVLPMSTDLDDLIRRDDDLYDMQGASDKQVAAERPKGLAARLDALGGPDPAHDADTGEIIDDDTNSASGDTTAPQPSPESSGAEAPRPSSRRAEAPEDTNQPPVKEAAKPGPAPAEKAPTTTASAAPKRGSEESEKIAYEAGRAWKKEGKSRRAVPGEYREAGAERELASWTNGYDDMADELAGSPGGPL